VVTGCATVQPEPKKVFDPDSSVIINPHISMRNPLDPIADDIYGPKRPEITANGFGGVFLGSKLTFCNKGKTISAIQEFRFKTVPIFMGLGTIRNDKIISTMILFVNPETKAWFIVEYFENKEACILTNGVNFKLYDFPKGRGAVNTLDNPSPKVTIAYYE